MEEISSGGKVYKDFTDTWVSVRNNILLHRFPSGFNEEFTQKTDELLDSFSLILGVNRDQLYSVHLDRVLPPEAEKKLQGYQDWIKSQGVAF